MIILKLKQDLLKNLTIYCDENNFKKDNLQLLINKYVKHELFSFYKPPEINCEKCHARLWDKGLQCTHYKKEGDYCNKHNRMIKIDGLLRFGDIREEKPKYDLIKLKDGKREKLNWINPDPINRLQELLDKHQRKLIQTTPQLILK